MTRGCRIALILLHAVALWAPSLGHVAGTASVPADSGHTYAVPVRTLKELRLASAFRTTVRQQHDFSCGSAALATLLTHHYGDPVTETKVFEAMYANGDRTKIRREGFSLLDMKRYLELRGYRADGVDVSLQLLTEAGVPAIALVNEQGYHHFVVIKGRRGNRVLLGDPALGTRTVTTEQLERARLGNIFFVIRNHRDDARFNGANDWMVRTPAPLDLGVARDSIATTLLSIPTGDRF